MTGKPLCYCGRTNEEWISQYSSSHRHPVNRICHTLGVPTILVSGLLFVTSIFFHRLWPYASALFLIGWALQFIGHAFEGKPPEFFHDWRFLFVGVRWWWATAEPDHSLPKRKTCRITISNLFGDTHGWQKSFASRRPLHTPISGSWRNIAFTLMYRVFLGRTSCILPILQG